MSKDNIFQKPIKAIGNLNEVFNLIGFFVAGITFILTKDEGMEWTPYIILGIAIAWLFILNYARRLEAQELRELHTGDIKELREKDIKELREHLIKITSSDIENLDLKESEKVDNVFVNMLYLQSEINAILVALVPSLSLEQRKRLATALNPEGSLAIFDQFSEHEKKLKEQEVLDQARTRIHNLLKL